MHFFAENAGKSPTPCSRALSLECIHHTHMAQAPGDFTLSGPTSSNREAFAKCLVNTSNIHQGILLSKPSYGCFLKWWYPQNTPKWSFLVGKPMVVGYHHLWKHPNIPKKTKKRRTCSHWDTALGSKPDSGKVKAQLFGRDWIEPGHNVTWQWPLVVEPIHLENLLVKLDHFPPIFGMETKKYLSCHHLET